MRILVFLACLASFAAAQSDSPDGGPNSPIRVCIAAPVNVSHLTISPSVQRDRLVYYINHSTQKKNARIRVEAVPVDGDGIRDTSAASEDQHCRFFVVSQFESNSSYLGGSSNGVGFGPVIPTGNGNSHRISLNYRVLRVESRSELDKGAFVLPSGRDEDSAATDATSQLSSRVVSVLTKQKPISVD